MEVETAEYLHQKAAQCLRLANGFHNQYDVIVAKLLALADEFEARALALAAEETSANQID